MRDYTNQCSSVSFNQSPGHRIRGSPYSPTEIVQKISRVASFLVIFVAHRNPNLTASDIGFADTVPDGYYPIDSGMNQF